MESFAFFVAAGFFGLSPEGCDVVADGAFADPFVGGFIVCLGTVDVFAVDFVGAGCGEEVLPLCAGEDADDDCAFFGEGDEILQEVGGFVLGFCLFERFEHGLVTLS